MLFVVEDVVAESAIAFIIKIDRIIFSDWLIQLRAENETNKTTDCDY
jgi:hypothetical protein